MRYSNSGDRERTPHPVTRRQQRGFCVGLVSLIPSVESCPLKCEVEGRQARFCGSVVLVKRCFDILRHVSEPRGNLHTVNKCELGEKVIGQPRVCSFA